MKTASPKAVRKPPMLTVTFNCAHARTLAADNMNSAYVINLDRRADRWARAQAVWSPWFKLERFPASDYRHAPALGCKMSHLTLATRMLEDQEMVIVLEDDAIPTPAFKEIGLQCIEQAREAFIGFDYCNCGPFLSVGKEQATLRAIPQMPLWLHSDYSRQTHFVLYNRDSLPLLRASLDSRLPLDIYLGTHAKRQFVPIRLLATQAQGPSDIGQSPKNQKHWYELSERMLEKAAQL
jgi:hypothetical protein